MTAGAAARDDLDDLRTALRADPAGVATALCGPPIRAKSTKRTARFEGLIDVVTHGPKRGLWFSFSGNGAGGDLLDLIQHIRGGSFGDVVSWARAWAGLTTAEPFTSRPMDASAAAAARAAAEARAQQRAAEAAADQAARIGVARRYWQACKPIGVGSLGETYLRSERGIVPPPGGWPSEHFRFHAKDNALVVAATDVSGLVTGVQRIFLDQLGRKLDDVALKARDLVAGKLSLGVLVGSFLRLPGDSAGPLLLAEGAETAVGTWVTSRHETWAKLGAVPSAELPAGRRVVVLGEDYAPGHPAAAALTAGLARWRQEGRNVVVAMPWAARRGDGSDFNDVLVQSGPAAVLERLALALNGRDGAAFSPSVEQARSDTPGHSHHLPAYYPAPTEPREQALARQRGLIRDVIRDGGVGAALRREIAAKREEALGFDKDQLTPSEKGAITRRVKREVLATHGLARIPSPRRVLVTGSQGTGKTSTALSTVAELHDTLGMLADLPGDISVRITQPSLDKAAEVIAAYRVIAGPDSLPAVLVRGRSADDPSRTEGTKMCPRHRVVQRAAHKGVQVRKTICASCPLRPTASHAGCGYMRQETAIEAMNGVGLFVMSAAYNFLPCPAPDADILIADEAITIAAIDEPARVSPSALDSPVPFKGSRLADVIAASKITTHLRDALTSPKPLAVLRAQGPSRDELVFARELLEAAVEARQEAAISGEMSDAQINTVLDDVDANTAGSALRVISAVLRELDQPRDVFNGISYDPAARVVVDGKEERQPRISVHRLRPLRGLAKDATVLLLDGTGSLRLNAALLPGVEHHRIAVERDAHVTGTAGRSYSRQSATGEDRNGEPIPNKAADAARLRREVRDIAARLPGDTLIVSTKRVAEKLQDEGAGRVAHFAKLRGMNEWEGCRSGISLGAQSVSVEAVEDQARPFMVDDPLPFISFAGPVEPGWGYEQWPFRATRGRRMRDGSVQPIEVEVHPDPRVQEVLEQIREAEVLQGIDRTRPVFNRRDLVLMNSLALDLTYDRVLTHRELVAGGSRAERILDFLGFLPLGGTDLMTAYPARLHGDGFPSAEAAEVWLKREGLRGDKPQIRTYLGFVPPFSYRRKGQRGSASRVLVDLQRHPNLRAALEAVLGPLAADPVPLSRETPDEPPDPPSPAAPRSPPGPPPASPGPVPPPAGPAAPRHPASADARSLGMFLGEAGSAPWAPSARSLRGSGAPSVEARWGPARDV